MSLHPAKAQKRESFILRFPTRHFGLDADVQLLHRLPLLLGEGRGAEVRLGGVGLVADGRPVDKSGGEVAK